MKYYAWDEKLSRDHFLQRYASAVKAIIVCLSADTRWVDMDVFLI